MHKVLNVVQIFMLTTQLHAKIFNLPTSSLAQAEKEYLTFQMESFEEELANMLGQTKNIKKQKFFSSKLLHFLHNPGDNLTNF